MLRFTLPIALAATLATAMPVAEPQLVDYPPPLNSTDYTFPCHAKVVGLPDGPDMTTGYPWPLKVELQKSTGEVAATHEQTMKLGDNFGLGYLGPLVRWTYNEPGDLDFDYGDSSWKWSECEVLWESGNQYRYCSFKCKG